MCSLAACLLAAAIGQPDRLLCVLRLELTCPRPLQPGVGHFKIVSCIARTRQRHGQQNQYQLSINTVTVVNYLWTTKTRSHFVKPNERVERIRKKQTIQRCVRLGCVRRPTRWYPAGCTILCYTQFCTT